MIGEKELDTPLLSRSAGRRQLLLALHDDGAASRIELARRTGLSSSTVSALVRDLQAQGLVGEEPASDAGRRRGRPAHVVSLRPPAGLVLGVDAGNTHVRVAVAEVDGPVLAERVVDDHDAREPDDTLRLAEALAGEVVAAAGGAVPDVRWAVLGVPAPLADRSGRVADNNILPRWVGRRPGADLADRLGVPVVPENDANLGALGEQRHGAGAGRPGASLMYLKLATGIGAGLVLDGRLFHGAGGTAGEVGHVQVDPAGVLCRCGSRGCLETVVSVPHLLRALAPVTSDDLGPDDLGRLVADGHTGALRVVTDAARTVGRVLASMVTVLNPDLLVVGGHLAPVNAVLADRIRAAVDGWAQPAAATCVTVCASDLDDRAEVLGALALATDVVLREQRAGLAG